MGVMMFSQDYSSLILWKRRLRQQTFVLTRWKVFGVSKHIHVECPHHSIQGEHHHQSEGVAAKVIRWPAGHNSREAPTRVAHRNRASCPGIEPRCRAQEQSSRVSIVSQTLEDPFCPRGDPPIVDDTDTICSLLFACRVSSSIIVLCSRNLKCKQLFRETQRFQTAPSCDPLFSWSYLILYLNLSGFTWIWNCFDGNCELI